MHWLLFYNALFRTFQSFSIVQFLQLNNADYILSCGMFRQKWVKQENFLYVTLKVTERRKRRWGITILFSACTIFNWNLKGGVLLVIFCGYWVKIREWTIKIYKLFFAKQYRLIFECYFYPIPWFCTPSYRYDAAKFLFTLFPRIDSVCMRNSRNLDVNVQVNAEFAF